MTFATFKLQKYIIWVIFNYFIENFLILLRLLGYLILNNLLNPTELFTDLLNFLTELH